MTLYHGNNKIRDTDSYGVYKGNQPIRAIYKGSQKVYWQQLTTTFNVSDSFQTYTVPANVTKLRIDCVASKGYAGSRTAGNGGRVQCDLDVTAGQTLYIMVGKVPTGGNDDTYNASDIRTNNSGVTNTTSLNSRLVVAGGGGSASTSTKKANGGAGGGTTGGSGGNYSTSHGGSGGTQTEGGARGSTSEFFPSYGSAGTFGLGGRGAYGGHGGAGWYGGGGGSGGSYGDTVCGGGGGGSSYAKSDVTSNVTHTQGYRDGAGYITITEIG